MRRSIRRLLSITLTICVVFSLALTAFAKPFSDVTVASVGIEYRDAINYVTDKGIMNGISSTTFAPNDPVNRAMFVTVLYRLSGDTTTYTNASVFTDVSSSSYYYNAVGWGVAHGIVSGATATTFGPNLTVPWQQAATFLYRFAGYMGMPQTADENLTQAADYSSLQSYARTPMSWMYSYGILLRSGNTANIYPNAVTTRGHIAMFLARYRRNVEGIVWNRDRFSFQNTRSHMLSGSALPSGDRRHLISTSDWQFLLDWAAQYAGSNERLYNTVKSWLEAKRDESWEGSCYGFSSATVADYYGKINISGSCANNCNSLYAIPAPSQNSDKHISVLASKTYMQKTIWMTAVESKINMFQLSWQIPTVSEWAYVDKMSVDEGLRNAYSSLRHGGIGVFTYTFSEPTKDSSEEGDICASSLSDDQNDQYHAIVLYGKPIPTSTGFRLKVYDNRYASQNCWIEANTTGTEWTGTVNLTTGSGSIRTEVIKLCKLNANCNGYNDVDLAGQNAILSADQRVNELDESSIDLDGKTVIYVESDNGFAVSNQEGEYFAFDDGEVTGTMRVHGFNFIPLGINRCQYAFLVDDSAKFTCSALIGSASMDGNVIDGGGDIQAFCVLGTLASGYVNKGAEEENGWHTVTISNDNGVEVE